MQLSGAHNMQHAINGQQRLITWKHRIWECESKLKTRVPLHCHWGSRSNAEAWNSESGGNIVCPTHRHISASGGRYNWKTKAKGEKQKKGVFLWKTNHPLYPQSFLCLHYTMWGWRDGGYCLKNINKRTNNERWAKVQTDGKWAHMASPTCKQWDITTDLLQ